MRRVLHLAIEFILIGAMKVPWLKILPLRQMFSLKEKRKEQTNKQMQALEVEPSLQASVLFALARFQFSFSNESLCWALPAAGPCCKSLLRSLHVSQQLLMAAVMVNTSSLSLKVSHKPTQAGDALRSLYTPLLPAQATPLFHLHKESFCLTEPPFLVQPQLLPHQHQVLTSNQAEEMSQLKCCLWMLLQRGEVRLFCSAAPAFLLAGWPQPLLPAAKESYNIKYIHRCTIY